MKRFLSLLLILSSLVSLGQSGKPEDIVKDFSSKMQGLESLSALFTFTLENLQEQITDTHQGKILVNGKMFYLDLMGMEVYSDGQTKWQYIKEAKEVTISRMDMSENGFLDDPTTLFKDYDKNFKFKYIGQQKEKNRVLHEVDFFPRDLNLPYSSVKIQFDAYTFEPFLIRYQGKDGNNYIIQIKSFKSNIPLRADRFIFDVDKHKGVEVIDMR